MGEILITGARQHNLQGVDVRIPRNALTVVTGLSGSGKSSLAFDTLYAEGQRRYVESLSAYARQFLDQMPKPDVERIEGLSPAIAIEQRTTSGNPRSIVATVTEIHDYLRLLYGTVAHAHCPECGRPVAAQSAESIVETLLALPEGTRLILLAPLVRGRKGRHEEVLANLARQGFSRVRIDGQICLLEEAPELEKTKNHSIEAVVDRLVISSACRSRLTDSVELALKVGSGLLYAYEEGAKEPRIFSERFACAHCRLSFEELKPRSFSFNSPYGACPTCSGLGALLVFDENLVVPDPTLPLRECIHPWRRAGHHAIVYYNYLLAEIARQNGVDLDTPFNRLDASFRHQLMHGFKKNLVLDWRKEDRPFEGVLPHLKRRYEEAETEEARERLAPYLARRRCPDCQGARLRPESRAARVAGRTIVEVMHLRVRELVPFLDSLPERLAPSEAAMVADVVKELRRRSRFLLDVGLDYLSLDRESATLSGGEMQRIRLATQIGSGLTGVLYVLDEPTIGLHPRDNERLIATLRELQRRGNTLVVVEHDEEMIRGADWLIDLGPGAGRMGGRVVFQGPPGELSRATESRTADYLLGRCRVPVPSVRVKPGKRWLRLTGARENNLQDVSVAIPLGLLVCVTGVSGSGKSTLVEDILCRALAQKLNRSKAEPGRYRSLSGVAHLDKLVEIDQSPIGRTPRSNPVTYIGAFSAIRELFALTPAAKARGYAPGRFSFNVKGGRCEACQGDGVRRLEMNFLPDVTVPCEVCQGARYNQETLQVRYKGKTIAEVLEMTVGEAVEFFSAIPSLCAKLRTLEEVGLGYIKLGQSSTTLSGGEAQRVKLAAELSKRATGKTIYFLDEPTTGLHFADVHRLLELLLKLRAGGNTVIVIEHNLDVAKSADWIIDMGPGGGDQGGRVVCAGPPEQIAACPDSATGAYLKPLLARDRADS